MSYLRGIENWVREEFGERLEEHLTKKHLQPDTVLPTLAEAVSKCRQEMKDLGLISVKKPKLSLVPSTFIIHVSKALEDGAEKYGAYNWREKKVSTMNLIDKIERHLQLFKDRHDYADDSKLHELSHIAADVAVYIDAMESGMVEDDRPLVGKANDVMNRFTKT